MLTRLNYVEFKNALRFGGLSLVVSLEKYFFFSASFDFPAKKFKLLLRGKFKKS